MTRNSDASSGISRLALDRLRQTGAQLQDKLSLDDSAKLRAAIESLGLRSVQDMMGRFEPMVVELAGQLGKRVDFAIEGDALLDSSRLQLLEECVLHILRNSLDHGLETDQERAALGKPAAGRLLLSCQEDGSSILLLISDDGRGIDEKALLKRAMEKQLLTEEQARKMRSADILDLIFTPGFSTKLNVSEISGRGVGMDVVKKNVELLKGRIQVTTHAGNGTRFAIRIPTYPAEEKSAESA